MNFETDKKKADQLYRMKQKLGRKFVPNFKMRLIVNLSFILAVDLTLYAFSLSIGPKKNSLYTEKLLQLDLSYFLNELIKTNEDIIIFTVLISFSLVLHFILLWVIMNLNTSKTVRDSAL